jgi:hypothetical protein
LREQQFEEGQKILGWRNVPTDDRDIGETARGTEPVIKQIFIESTLESEDDFERKLYVIRKRAENEVKTERRFVYQEKNYIRAGIIRRNIADRIDNICWVIIFGVVYYIVKMPLLSLFLSIPLFVFYYILLIYKFNQTVGGMLLKIKVISLINNGKFTINQILKRGFFNIFIPTIRINLMAAIPVVKEPLLPDKLSQIEVVQVRGL